MTAMIASAWSARPEAMTVRQPTIIARPSPLSATTPTIMIPTSNRSSTSSSHASTRQAPKPRPDYRCQPLAPFTLGEGARPRPIAYPDQNTGVMPSICGRRLTCRCMTQIGGTRLAEVDLRVIPDRSCSASRTCSHTPASNDLAAARASSRSLLMKLYQTHQGTNPRRVSIYLAEKGIDVPRVEVDVSIRAQKSAELLALNPAVRMP